MVSRTHYRLVETIISTLKEEDNQISYELLSKKTHIKANSLKKWLKIIELVQSSSISLILTEDGISRSSLSKLDVNTNIQTRIKKREEDPNLQKFLAEFNCVLAKTRISIEDEKAKNYPYLNARPKDYRKLSSEHTDLQTELTQALEQGLSYLSSSEQVNVPVNSKTEGGFLQELKQAVNLGIENLEKVVVTDYKVKKGRVNAMKTELETVFENRKKRLKERNNP
ncbi:MAG: hypothetical protein KAT16_07685 [Candidatus Heimdallarchaeota archaeon]|nr:hypothetical protein [Candidatus Heimdallarchaeota archaeon]